MAEKQDNSEILEFLQSYQGWDPEFIKSNQKDDKDYPTKELYVQKLEEVLQKLWIAENHPPGEVNNPAEPVCWGNCGKDHLNIYTTSEYPLALISLGQRREDLRFSRIYNPNLCSSVQRVLKPKLVIINLFAMHQNNGNIARENRLNGLPDDVGLYG